MFVFFVVTQICTFLILAFGILAFSPFLFFGYFWPCGILVLGGVLGCCFFVFMFLFGFLPSDMFWPFG